MAGLAPPRYDGGMETPRVPPGFSLESGIRRDAEGRWFHDGAPVENEAVARAFDAWIDRNDEDGRYVLENSVNWAYIELEGAPFFVRSADPGPDGVTLLLSDGTEEQLDLETVRQDAAGNLYCTVKAGRLAARFTRKATLQLEPLVAEDEAGVLLRVGGKAVHPPVVEDAVGD